MADSPTTPPERRPLAELVAPDWAAALEPQAERISAMGDFLRAELAAGRGYLPAGPNVLRAFARPMAEVRVLIVGQDPYPTPGHAVGPVVLRGPRRAAGPAQPGQHLPRAARRPRLPHSPRPAT